MRLLFLGALPCLLAAQAPLTYDQILASARPAPEAARAEARLAEAGQRLQETRGLLREGPTLALTAGPRRSPGASTSTDRSLELDLPLFLSPSSRRALAQGLAEGAPLIREAARRESRLRLRATYLDAWLAERELALREADVATVARWLDAARARLDAGADPAFQVSLVQGEQLKALQERDEARTRRGAAWARLAALAELPFGPVPLAEPGAPAWPEGADLDALEACPLAKALKAQADLDAQSLRLEEAQALNRWSLRASCGREGEETVGRLGLALRLPRPGEASVRRRATESQRQVLRAEARQALAELGARLQDLRARFAAREVEAPLPDFRQAVEAVGLRLQEGKERPSEALPIRRQLLEAQLAALRRHHAHHTLAAELQSLLPEVKP